MTRSQLTRHDDRRAATDRYRFGCTTEVSRLAGQSRVSRLIATLSPFCRNNRSCVVGRHCERTKGNVRIRWG